MLFPEEIHCTNANGDRLVIRNLMAVCANDVIYEQELGKSEPAQRLEEMVSGKRHQPDVIVNSMACFLRAVARDNQE